MTKWRRQDHFAPKRMPIAIGFYAVTVKSISILHRPTLSNPPMYLFKMIERCAKIIIKTLQIQGYTAKRAWRRPKQKCFHWFIKPRGYILRMRFVITGRSLRRFKVSLGTQYSWENEFRNLFSRTAELVDLGEMWHVVL